MCEVACNLESTPRCSGDPADVSASGGLESSTFVLIACVYVTARSSGPVFCLRSREHIDSLYIAPLTAAPGNAPSGILCKKQKKNPNLMCLCACVYQWVQRARTYALYSTGFSICQGIFLFEACYDHTSEPKRYVGTILKMKTGKKNP